MRTNFGKPDISHKSFFQLAHRFRFGTENLNFVDNHEEQSLSFHLIHI